MIHTVQRQEDGVYHRFFTPSGVVVARVRDRGNGEASVDVYEREAVLASGGLTDEEAARLPQHVSARNRFRTGTMLRMMRALVASMPEVRTWVYERKSGANAGRSHARAY